MGNNPSATMNGMLAESRAAEEMTQIQSETSDTTDTTETDSSNTPAQVKTAVVTPEMYESLKSLVKCFDFDSKRERLSNYIDEVKLRPPTHGVWGEGAKDCAMHIDNPKKLYELLVQDQEMLNFSVNEIVNIHKSFRLFFDIDLNFDCFEDSNNAWVAKTLISGIVKEEVKLFFELEEVPLMYTCVRSDSPNLHFVFPKTVVNCAKCLDIRRNIITRLREHEVMSKFLTEKEVSKIVDGSVYQNKASLRMIGCRKYNKKREMVGEPYYPDWCVDKKLMVEDYHKCSILIYDEIDQEEEKEEPIDDLCKRLGFVIPEWTCGYILVKADNIVKKNKEQIG